MKRFLSLVFGLGLLGDIAAILIAPKIIRYWYTPPVGGTTTMVTNPVEVLNYGMNELVKYQIIGTAIGMALGMLFALLFWRRTRRTAAAVAAPVSAPVAATPQIVKT